MPELLKSDLYASEGTTSAPDYPSLKGGKCAHCGYVFFPLQPYGCEVCGRAGDSLKPLALSGCGTLIASTKVHIHKPRAPAERSDIKPREAPFMIGSIKLDDGPTIRTLLVDADERALKPGQRVVGKLVPVGEGAQVILDLRFTPAS
ncbi:Zn-ribbon domain-containing OB-fold protein [Bradyrhizobium sp. BWA-3-5]|uniref:Zn-ribbon domain-containing OB-fold protein n=1 Tax=Bradyrhizobium sp. BWA-3-5 TaxID=3080013 RepID=UPI00293F23A4|nr:OB-fold domain-containing protein [Bradyrhizobium sp. BWA-3-5]WOH63950.1 OB-fold domain-containing protein [Bradyrhizobium sp. BWA-3-5]